MKKSVNELIEILNDNKQSLIKYSFSSTSRYLEIDGIEYEISDTDETKLFELKTILKEQFGFVFDIRNAYYL